MKIKQRRPLTSITNFSEISTIQQVLALRKVPDMEDFFNLTWDDVQEPENLLYVEEAANKIIDHCKNQRLIYLLVDCDMDGYSAAATLYNYLTDLQKKSIFPELRIKLFYHEDKTHGLDDKPLMRAFRDTPPNLLIIPDASGSKEQYQALTDLGIDIVVIDHHETIESGDGDKVIVVNNQHSPLYTNKQLSGVGVVWQVCRKMDKILGTDIANNYLWLLALGLVGDVMNIGQSRETRFLVSQGISKKQKENSPFLKECLLQMDFSLKGKISPISIAFYIVPMFNAVNRIGDMTEREYSFKCLLNDFAETLVESGKRGAKNELVPLVTEGLRLMTNCKARQKRREGKLTELLENMMGESLMHEQPVLFFAINDPTGEELRPLSGLSMNVLQDEYHRPCIIGFKNKDGTYSGSMRCPEDIPEFANFRQQCLDSKKFIYASGHQYACGVAFTEEMVTEIPDYFYNKFDGADLEPTKEVDFVFEYNDPELMDVLEELSDPRYSGMWGHGLKEPTIAVMNVPIRGLKLLSPDKSPTLKLRIPGTDIDLIKFKASQEEFQSIKDRSEDGVGKFYIGNFIITASMNEWKGEITYQGKVEDYEIIGSKLDL